MLVSTSGGGQGRALRGRVARASPPRRRTPRARRGRPPRARRTRRCPCSWVMSMMVMPRSRFSRCRISMTSMLVRRVQVAGGLVGQQDLRLVDQRARDGHALLLPARELVRGVVRRARRGPTASSSSCARRARCGGGHGLRRVEQRQLHVLEGGGAGQQVEVLEHEADLPVAQRRRGGRGRSRRRPRPRGSSWPRGRPVEQAEDVHEGRLAAARGADHGEERPRRDVEGDAAQRVDGDVAQRVGLLAGRRRG